MSKDVWQDVKTRPAAPGCLEHRWFKNHEASPPPLSVGVTQCLVAKFEVSHGTL